MGMHVWHSDAIVPSPQSDIAATHTVPPSATISSHAPTETIQFGNLGARRGRCCETLADLDRSMSLGQAKGDQAVPPPDALVAMPPISELARSLNGFFSSVASLF